MGFLSRYRSLSDLPDVIPVFPLGGVLLLPRAQLPLNVFEPRYLAMVDHALAGDRLIGIIQPDGEAAIAVQSDPRERPPLARVGCSGRITAFAEAADSRIAVTLTGVCRFVVAGECPATRPFREIEPDFSPFLADLGEAGDEDDVDRETLLATLHDYLEAHDLRADWEQVRAASNEELVNSLAILSPYGPADKQALLEAADLASRAELLVALTERALSRRAGTVNSRLQ